MNRPTPLTALANKVSTIFNLPAKIVSVGILIFRIKFVQRKKIIFIYRTVGIGDIVCAFSAIRQLKNAYPDHVIIFGTQEVITSLLELHPDIDIVLQTSDVSPIPKLYRRFFDRYYPLTTSIEGKRGAQSKHLTQDISDNFGISVTPTYFPLTIPSHDIDEARRTMSEIGEEVKLVIAVCNGPSGAVKIWPIENWNLLIARLTEEFDCKVIQLGAHKIERISGTFDLTNSLTLRQSAAILSQCDLMIGIDSGLLHIARAVGTDAVGIFGPTLANLIVDIGTYVVQSNVECTGCHHSDPRGHWNDGCPNDMKCMPAIPIDAVFVKAKAVLDRLSRH